MDHNFFTWTLEKYDLNVILCVKILCRGQESCVLNSGATTWEEGPSR